MGQNNFNLGGKNMYKKLFVLLLTGILVLAFSLPAFAAISNTQINGLKQEIEKEGIPKDKQEILYNKIISGELPDVLNSKMQSLIPSDFYTSNQKDKQFVFPDGSYLKISVEKSEKIPVTSENKGKLLAISGNNAYVDNLYAQNTLSPLIVQYLTIWVQGYSGVTSCKYKEDIILDGDYGQSQITNVYPESLTITVLGGSYSLITAPTILNRQQSGTNPATSYCKFQVTIPGVLSATETLESYVRDGQYWATFTH